MRIVGGRGIVNKIPHKNKRESLLAQMGVLAPCTSNAKYVHPATKPTEPWMDGTFGVLGLGAHSTIFVKHCYKHWDIHRGI